MLTKTNTNSWPFKYVPMGNYCQFKQRFNRDIAEAILRTPAVEQFRNDLIAYVTHSGNHIVIAGVTTQANITTFLDCVTIAKGERLIRQGNAMINRLRLRELGDDLPF